ncbi:hypothetical protein ACHQM5_026102 [Ranunculus cassubicifolius]
MDDTRRYITNQQLDIKHILVEAQHRWLRTNEVCEILRNYKMFQLTPDPPQKPPGGSLFLFDRKVLRYFRKDGHTWRKKKDGKTVREAHEKLKVGSIDVLHCYYAHGEDDDSFQRRCYWMLDTQLEHIVLVHYRVVKEGSRSNTFGVLTPEAATQTGSSQSCSAPLSAQVDSNAPTIQASYASSPSTENFNGHTSYSELLEDVESKEDLITSPLADAIMFSGRPNVTQHLHDKEGFSTSSGKQGGTGFGDKCFIHLSDRPMLSDILSFNTGPPNSADFVTRKITDVKVEPFNFYGDGLDPGAMLLPDGHAEVLLRSCHKVFQETLANGNSDQADYVSSKNHEQNGISSSYDLSNENQFQFLQSQLQDNSGSCQLVSSNGHSSGLGNACVKAELHNDESRELKKLDSFGRWMNKELGRDCDDSLMGSDSGNYWNTVDTENDDKEVSSLSQHMQLDNDSLPPSLSQEQLFSICDFSPDWAYSGIETKVLVSGSFLCTRKRLGTTEWCCMFGEVEVPAEVLADNVLRCQAPLHAAGRVPFYITCSNRLACSEVRDFEYRENPSCQSSLAVISEPEDEMRLQIRLAKLLCLGLKQNTVDCSFENCEKCNIKNELTSTWNEEKKEWERIEKASMAFEQNHENPKDSLIRMLLKDKLSDWLVCSVHEEGKGPHILDDEGQGVIHLAAALGFDWAMSPIVSAGVSPSYRDAHGRTGLHWAAYYGREETVVALVKLGAAPGAVDDPTSNFPGGRTAADLASSRGHKGIGGYLAEADLTSHLSSLIRKMGSVAATIAPEEAVETVSVEGIEEGQLSLKSSLDAVKKSAEAAALIQASFRAHSFQYRQLSSKHDEVTMDVVALASSSVTKGRKMSHFSDYLHTAATKIQQKYRGWKGRKEFLIMRSRVVKIQAHVRGHQVRKQYKKVVWSVSILEKVILRWRRKRVGLRGFRADTQEGGDSRPEAGKTDDYEFLRLGRKQKVAGVEKALARVQSMVRDPEARDQYMRLSTNFQKLKIGCKSGDAQNIDKDATTDSGSMRS